MAPQGVSPQPVGVAPGGAQLNPPAAHPAVHTSVAARSSADHGPACRAGGAVAGGVRRPAHADTLPRPQAVQQAHKEVNHE